MIFEYLRNGCFISWRYEVTLGGGGVAETLKRSEQYRVFGNVERDSLVDDLRDRIFFCGTCRWFVYNCGGRGSEYLEPQRK